MDKSFLASDAAIEQFGAQLHICSKLSDLQPGISTEHGIVLIREIAFWRTRAGLLPKKEKK